MIKGFTKHGNKTRLPDIRPWMKYIYLRLHPLKNCCRMDCGLIMVPGPKANWLTWVHKTMMQIKINQFTLIKESLVLLPNLSPRHSIKVRKLWRSARKRLIIEMLTHLRNLLNIYKSKCLLCWQASTTNGPKLTLSKPGKDDLKVNKVSQNY